MGVVTYHALEYALRGVADYDRGVWEGGSVVFVVQGCMAIAQRVLKRKDAQS